MTNPWNGPRHNSWLSNTVLAGIALFIVFVATMITDALNGAEPPPTYLTGLLGVAAGTFFGAVGSDKSKKYQEVKDTAETAKEDANTAKNRAAESSLAAIRAELKADIPAEMAAKEHPEIAGQLPPPLIPPHLRGPSSKPPEEEGGQT